MIISSKECCSVGCREESKCFSYRDTRLSTTLSTETFAHATQIRWIITLTFLNKAIFSFFRIVWIIYLVSNIEWSIFLQDFINCVSKLATNTRQWFIKSPSSTVAILPVMFLTAFKNVLAPFNPSLTLSFWYIFSSKDFKPQITLQFSVTAFVQSSKTSFAKSLWSF